MISKVILAMIALCSSSEMSGTVNYDEKGKKEAILMVHFGSTNDETRQKTIEALNNSIAEMFPEAEVREAYSSRIVIDRLGKKGVVKKTPSEMIEELKGDGFGEITVQSSFLLPGKESDALKEELSANDGLKFGKPLLSSVDDSRELAKILIENYRGRDDEMTIFIGHGSATTANALYSQLELLLHDLGGENMFVSTVEGFPDYESTLKEIKRTDRKKVSLVPLMFVAGEHFTNDINGEWKERLASEGYDVRVVASGLGELPEIRKMYGQHIMEAMKGENKTALEEKMEFVEENI